jgi:hypothetical protein
MSCSRALSVGSASKSFGHTSAEFSNRTKLSSATKARQALNLRLYCFWPGIYNRAPKSPKSPHSRVIYNLYSIWGGVSRGGNTFVSGM